MLLGGFDGLHIGHKKLVARAKAHGLPVGVTAIVGGKAGKPLFTLSERAEIFGAAGLDFVFELPFDEIKDISPEAFVRLLVKEFSPKAFVCGDDFRFGRAAAGTPETLKTVGQVCVETEELLTYAGEKVSSTAVKKLLGKGDTERANVLLGERFFLMGEVYQDRKIGRTIGFPTANIAYPSEKFPIKKGVYETRVCVDGKAYKGVTNYGARPTFGNEAECTETYLDGFAGELYGKTLKVEFVRYLRDIKKFESAEALKKQLQADIAAVRREK